MPEPELPVKIVAVILIFTCAASAGVPEGLSVISRQSAGGLLQMRLSANGLQFTARQGEEWLSAIAADIDQTFPTLWLSVVSPAKADFWTAHKPAADMTYSIWRDHFVESQKEPWCMALLIRTHSGQAILYRSVTGSLQRMLKGGDATRFHVGGNELEIVNIAVAAIPRVRRAQRDAGQNFAEIYCKASTRPTVDFAKQATAFLRKYLGATAVALRLNEDGWFIDEFRFPIAPPLLAGTSPPGLQKYLASPIVVCLEGFDAEADSCRVQTR